MKKIALVSRPALGMARGSLAAAVSAAMIALALGATAPAAWASDRVRQKVEVNKGVSERGRNSVVQLKDGRLKIELNSTDHDVGIQLFLDADPWKTMDIFDPNGKRVFRATTSGRVGKQGGTELFLESAEPNFDQLSLAAFLERFPVGDYRIEGKGLNGEKIVGSAKFTHNIPLGPVLVSPVEDAMVDPNNAMVMWNAVPAPNGSPIVGYQVLVVKPDSGIPAIPKIILDVMMPPTATSMVIPPGFLLPNSLYEWEVLAVEAGGNQTLSVGHFGTAGSSATVRSGSR